MALSSVVDIRSITNYFWSIAAPFGTYPYEFAAFALLNAMACAISSYRAKLLIEARAEPTD